MSPRSRGTGHVRQSPYRDRQGRKVLSDKWEFTYYVRRLRKHDTVRGFRSQAAAERALRAKLGDQDRGALVGADVERTTFEDLARLIVADYVSNERDSLPRLEQSLAHLREWFGEDRASDVTDDRVELYKAGRLTAGAKPATVNRELAALKRMFKLARKRVAMPPTITMLAERNVRRGFFEEAAFLSAQAKLPDEAQRDAVDVAYITGWRMPSEVLTREWSHVDFAGGWLVLEPGEAKTEDPRRFPLDPHLRPLFERRRALTRRLELKTGRVIPWVFWRVTKAGRASRVQSFYKAWHRACREAGVPGRIPHDFRRTAFRNLRRSGVDVLAAMQLVGWSSFAMAKRYGATDEVLLKESAAKMRKRG